MFSFLDFFQFFKHCKSHKQSFHGCEWIPIKFDLNPVPRNLIKEILVKLPAKTFTRAQKTCSVICEISESIKAKFVVKALRLTISNKYIRIEVDRWGCFDFNHQYVFEQFRFHFREVVIEHELTSFTLLRAIEIVKDIRATCYHFELCKSNYVDGESILELLQILKPKHVALPDHIPNKVFFEGNRFCDSDLLQLKALNIILNGSQVTAVGVELFIMQIITGERKFESFNLQAAPNFDRNFLENIDVLNELDHDVYNGRNGYYKESHFLFWTKEDFLDQYVLYIHESPYGGIYVTLKKWIYTD